MSSIHDALATLDAAVQAVGGLDWEAVAVRERLGALDRLETMRRRAGAAALDLLGSIERSKDPALGGATAKIVADILRITPTEARRRIRDTGQLHHRTSLTGQALPPLLTTRKRRDGSTEWRPPPQIPLPGGTNDYHHPERLLPED
jgi:hypothetical protein